MAVPLVQLHPRAPALPRPAAGLAAGVRKPGWLRVPAPGGPTYLQVKATLRELGLHTVCEEARCPNIGECWEHHAATFMILGDVCTRNCAYCAVAHGTPAPVDPAEPVRLAEAVERMGLRHVVITSVDRDDLPHGGAEAFAACVTEIRRRLPEATVEVLIPDFKGSAEPWLSEPINVFLPSATVSAYVGDRATLALRAQNGAAYCVTTAEVTLVDDDPCIHTGSEPICPDDTGAP